MKNDPNEKSVLNSEIKENIEVWEDLVNIKSMVISLCICSITTMGGYFIAPNDPLKPLFFGLAGAIIGFIVCSVMIDPKRIFYEENQEE